MSTNNSVAFKNMVTVTEADLAELQKAREQKEAQRKYRRDRNQRPDVKMKNAEYHTRKNLERKAHAAAFQFLVEAGLITEDMISKVEIAVTEWAEYHSTYDVTE